MIKSILKLAFELFYAATSRRTLGSTFHSRFMFVRRDFRIQRTIKRKLHIGTDED